MAWMTALTDATGAVVVTCVGFPFSIATYFTVLELAVVPGRPSGCKQVVGVKYT